MGDLLYVRDSILVDEALSARLAGAVGAGSSLRLVARTVTHAAGYTLHLPGVDLTVIAQHYDANGGGVSVAGAAGAAGATGADGAFHGLGRDGGPGRPGTPGSDGQAGGRIHLWSEELVQGRFCADGGPGGPGGDGGQGGPGGPARPPIPHKTEGGEPGGGGPGGDGARGGAGGAGGTVQIRYMRAAAEPTATATGGAGGGGGAAGAGGPDGGFDRDVRSTLGGSKPAAAQLGPRATGADGRPGAPGAAGAAGTTSCTRLTDEQYWSQVAGLLGADQATWADARLAAGEYFYRRDAAPAAGQPGDLAVAAGELARVLRLRPGDPDATRLAAQIAHNQNVLGLARNLDVTPNFQAYIAAYTAWGGQVFGEFDQGVNELLSASTMVTVRQQLVFHRSELADNIVACGADHAAAVAGQKTADQDVTFATDKVQQLVKQIQAAKKEMEDTSISIGGILSTVAEVAGAVCAVIAAIPTGGASLIALVPDCIALTKTVLSEAPVLVSALFGDGSVPKEVKDAYDKAGQDVGKLVAAGKAIVNLVDTIDKLDQAKTAANAKYTDLVRQGLEAGHALALAQLGAEQADLLTAAAQVKLDQAQALKTQADELMTAETADTATVLAAGQTLIEAAAMRRDDLLEDAFLAQRSLAIYTDTDDPAAVRMDAGYLHPDILADYAEGYRALPEMIGQYGASWDLFLAPMSLQQDYLAYFSGQASEVDIDWHRITIRHKELLRQVRKTHALDLEIRLSDLPAHHREAKVQSISVALVGATSPSGMTSCEITHGSRYEEKLTTGATQVQLLTPHTDTVLAPHTRLARSHPPALPADPMQAPLDSPVWGRGIAGPWHLTIPQGELGRGRTSLAKLTEIDIWIAYQFRTT